MRRPPSSPLRVVAGLLLTGATATAALGGCGSRGPLDEATSVTADAAVEAEVIVDATPAEAEAPAPETGPRDAGPVACGLCVLSSCGDIILACLQAEACRGVFQCVATECLAGGGGGGGGGGGINPLCLFQCAGDDPSGALGVLSVFQCITGQCGDVCSSLLGGLGGLGGGSGGGGGGGSGGGGGGGNGFGGGGGGGGDGAPESFRQLFSPWPELLTRPGVPPRGEAAPNP